MSEQARNVVDLGRSQSMAMDRMRLARRATEDRVKQIRAQLEQLEDQLDAALQTMAADEADYLKELSEELAQDLPESLEDLEFSVKGNRMAISWKAKPEPLEDPLSAASAHAEEAASLARAESYPGHGVEDQFWGSDYPE